jgi:hypothetical protein
VKMYKLNKKKIENIRGKKLTQIMYHFEWKTKRNH